MNPKKSANFAKTLGNRSKTDAKILYRFDVLLNEEDLKIPVIDKTTEKLGSISVAIKLSRRQ